MPLDLDRLGDRLGDPRHDPHRALDAACVVQQNDKLVAAKPRNRIAGAHAGHQAPCYLDQNAVAVRVPQQIIDVLEMVQVHEQDGYASV